MKSLSTEGITDVAKRLRICAEIEEAHQKGAQVEYKNADLPNQRWYPASTPTYSFRALDYRVKEEPRTLYVVYTLHDVLVCATHSKDRAHRAAPNGKLVEYREVVK